MPSAITSDAMGMRPAWKHTGLPGVPISSVHTERPPPASRLWVVGPIRLDMVKMELLAELRVMIRTVARLTRSEIVTRVKRRIGRRSFWLEVVCGADGMVLIYVTRTG
jgi:hypothetical protein